MIFSLVLLLLLAAGAMYHLFAFFCVLDFFRRREKDPEQRQAAAPPVSILKPLKEPGPELAENIGSFCRQDYPEYEVLLGYSDPDARSTAEAAAGPYAGRVRVVASSGRPGSNRKVSNLQGLAEAARFPLLAISDGDMRAGPDYLRRTVKEFLSVPDAGMVTCPYKITAPLSTGAAMESLTTALDFIPSVLVARRLEGVTFGLGASMLVSKKGLDDIGGFLSIADYLADDYQLGNRLWKRGYRIVLSRVVLENMVGRMSIRDFFAHQLRWARTYRASRPKGFAGYGITFIIPLALMFLAVDGMTASGLTALAAAFLLRFTMAALVCGTVIRTAQWLAWLPLLPVKDIASFGIWLWSFAGRTVRWSGRSFRIVKEGKIVETGRSGPSGTVK